MDFSFLDILTVAYFLSGILGFSGFLNTFRDVWNKIPSANVSTYIQWSIVNGVGALYGIFKIEDLVFTILSSAGFIMCVLILILRLRITDPQK